MINQVVARHDHSYEHFKVKSVNMKMEPAIESDMVEGRSINDDVPIEVSEMENLATPSLVARSRYSSNSTRNRKAV